MPRPAVKNGVPITMTNPPLPPVARSFDGPLPIVGRNFGGFPVVTVVSTLGGLPFVATLFSVKTLVDGSPVVLEGAIVTTPDGYVGTVTAAQCAGVGINVV
jgi:hypothetical protein